MVHLKIQARRFECHNAQCKRKIFCERLSHFSGTHDQRSARLTTMIRAIGRRSTQVMRQDNTDKRKMVEQ